MVASDLDMRCENEVFVDCLVRAWQFALLHYVSSYSFTPQQNVFAAYSTGGMWNAVRQPDSRLGQTGKLTRRLAAGGEMHPETCMTTMVKELPLDEPQPVKHCS